MSASRNKAGATAAEKTKPDPFDNLRRTTLGSMFSLAVQFGLGISYSLYGKMPTARSSVSIFEGPVLILHETIGLLIFGGSVHTLTTARAAKNPVAVASSAVAVLLLAAATVTGLVFLRHGSTAASMTMGLTGSAAFLCFLINLVAIGRCRSN